MSEWSLNYLLNALQADVENRLDVSRHAFQHTTTKGDASETVWVELLRKYLPQRYKIDRAHIVDKKGNFSKQIDLVIYDRHFTPPIFDFSGEIILPAESVYAVFEVKQKINADYIAEALDKFATVADFDRNGVAITNANTIKPISPKKPFPIIGGILALECEWNPVWGDPMLEHLQKVPREKQLVTGCIARHGWFVQKADNGYEWYSGSGKTTAWLFNLITLLQDLGSVPAIDMAAYARHFDKPAP
ncbi:MAG: hypothetical protein RL748_2431 [Pseudomonadota bacterium]|jgi:hypothetical protein